MKQEDWINAHVHMYEYFGGVTRILVSDNLKTGVISNKKNDDPVMSIPDGFTPPVRSWKPSIPV